jgi:PAS domain S-box-containing protein
VGVTTAIRRSLSLTVMLGISAIACGVMATISLVQYRETRASLATVQEEEGRQVAIMLATSVAAMADAETSGPRLDPAAVGRLLGAITAGVDLAEIAVVDRAGAIVARTSSGSETPADVVTAAVAPVLARGEPFVERSAALLTFGEPIRGQTPEEGRPPVVAAVYLRAAPQAVVGEVADMAWRIGLAAAGLAGVGLVLALALSSRFVLHSARALATGAAVLAERRTGLDPAADAKGNELARLGHAVDAMAEQIAVDGERLQAGAIRYREVVEAAGDGIFTADHNGVFLDVNPSGCALVQRSREEIVGRFVGEFIHPDEVDAVAVMIGQLLAGETVVREWRMRLPGDVYAPVEVNATRLADGRLQGITRDISERKRAEEELRRSVRRKQAVATLGQHALGRAPVQQLMDEAVTLVADGLDAPFAKVLELLPSGNAFRLRAAAGWPASLVGTSLEAFGPESQARFTLQRDATVVVEDLATETRFSGPTLKTERGIVSGLSVVIRSAAEPFGVLAVHGIERRHFTSDDVHFVEAVANVLAMAIARATADEALRASELRYRLAARATHDAMYDWDIANDRTYWSEGIEWLFGHAPGAVGPGIDWWKQYIHPEDRDAMLASVSATLMAGVREWRAKYRFQRADGTYATVRDRGYVEYAPDGTPLRAVGAMTDVTEQNRTEEAVRRQATFVALSREVATAANQAVGVSEAVRAILRLVCTHTGWPVGHAVLLDRSVEQATPPSLWYLADPVRFGELRAMSDATPYRRGIGTIGQVWKTGQPAWVAETHAPSLRRAAAMASGLHGGFAFPVLVGATVVGVLEFLSEDDVPPADDLVAVLEGIGTQLGRVIERAEAEDHLREYAERLEGLSRRLIEAQETERRHVARELHDEIGQALTALKLNLRAIERETHPAQIRGIVEESLALADRTLQQTRDLSLDLRPALLDDLGLVPALRWYLDRQGRRAGFATEFIADEIVDAVPSEVATTCFRIAQEALTNVVRHAQATAVTMSLARQGAALELVVRDSGRGFDTALAMARAQHGASLGLLGMRERAALIGATLVIESTPGQGTAIRVLLPLVAGSGELNEPARRTA